MSYIVGLGLQDIEKGFTQARDAIQNVLPGGKGGSSPSTPATGPASSDPLAPVLTNSLNIKLGMAGPAIDKARSLLSAAGYVVSPAAGSGWGGIDQQAVSRFQADHGLPINGEFNGPTYQKFLDLGQGGGGSAQPYVIPYPSQPYGTPYKSPLSTGAKVAIGVGAVWVAGLGYWLVTKKKPASGG
jgi:peptidoglycan hydrolase-like protein with peptidoglycan-binding domain